MGVVRNTALVIGGASILLLTTAGLSDEGWPWTPTPADVVVLPVLTSSQNVGEHIAVCMNHGARQRSYRVMNSACRRGAEHCTAFVAVPIADAENFVPFYDITNPPVEATGPACDLPMSQPNGFAPALQ